MSLSMQTPLNPGPCEGFDEFAGRFWYYPNNRAIRKYQKQAVEKSLFNNAMIVLPTGFGKTFIAAVVMYNFWQWYPRGKIIFVAPTRPLVAQQIEECKKVSGIPSSDCVELTGQKSSEQRRNLWQQKRVFFATPQVIENDLTNGLLPPKDVRCIIIDEAHRAQGNYAYVQIVRNLHENNRNGFRVVALSATPGSDIQKVRQVMLNLYISDVMFRSENSLDLMQFKNQKNSKAWTVQLTPTHKRIVDSFIKITSSVYRELYKAGLTYSGQSIEQVARYTLVKANQQIINNEVSRAGTTKGRLRFLCGAALSLSHHFELLTLYGIRVFFSALQKTLSEPRSNAKAVLGSSVELEKIKMEIEKMFGQYVEPDHTVKADVDLTIGHPKLRVVKELLFKHFEEHRDRPDTRAIVFTKYRESVYDIVQTLKAFEPLIKAGAFVGQGGANGATGMKQREQIQLISDFKSGKYNVLVATCVAEEGLDIGEVDLIICYDTTSSPISTTQRRGRTGRKRSGNVQTLVTKDYEEKKLRKAGASRRQVEDQLYKRENYIGFRYKDAPRMVPSHVLPVCFEQTMAPAEDDNPVEETNGSKRRKRAKRTVVRPVQEEESDSGDLFSAKKSKKKNINNSADSDIECDDLFSAEKSEEQHRIETADTDIECDDLFSAKESEGKNIAESADLHIKCDDLSPAKQSTKKNINESADSDIEWDDDIDLSQVKIP